MDVHYCTVLHMTNTTRRIAKVTATITAAAALFGPGFSSGASHVDDWYAENVPVSQVSYVNPDIELDTSMVEDWRTDELDRYEAREDTTDDGSDPDRIAECLIGKGWTGRQDDDGGEWIYAPTSEIQWCMAVAD